MADKTIPQLPNLLSSGVTPNDLLVIVNYDLPSGTTKNIKAFDLQSYINSGVISLTGSTYNPTIGVLSFTNSTGGTVTVSGFTTGGTGTSLYEVGTGLDSTQRIVKSLKLIQNKTQSKMDLGTNLAHVELVRQQIMLLYV